MVPNYTEAFDVILDDEPEYDVNENNPIEKSAMLLYGLIHCRYILTNRGIAAMLSKYLSSEFGTCPRVYCENQSLLPIGKISIISHFNVFD